MSVAPVKEVTTDFGVMSRHEGDPVPYEHEFYRATLQGLFSLDLSMSGRFYSVQRTGFKHLDAVRVKLAQERGLAEFDGGKAYELPTQERVERITKLFEGFITMTGGAKLAVHYTDVAPKFLLMAVGAGGNHLFSTAVGTDDKGRPLINFKAIREAVRVFRQDILSGLYVGLTQGYLDGQRAGLEEVLNSLNAEYGIKTYLGHPREAVQEFIQDLWDEEGNDSLWLK